MDSLVTRPFTLGSMFVVSALLTGCDDDIISDAGFDLWCGEDLCEWETEVGTIRRVSTWHKDDYGVELMGAPVRISQLVNTPTQCLKFKVIANVSVQAQVNLEIDLLDDGQVEHVQRLPGAQWQALEFLLSLPEQAAHAGLRVALHKEGDGVAVFGELSAEEGTGCAGEPIKLENVPNGSPCSSGESCRSRRCVVDPGDASAFNGTCGECESDADCAGEACGLVLREESGRYYRACVPPGSVELDAGCDIECMSGTCDGSSCL